jgi:uncharacterized membrane protein
MAFEVSLLVTTLLCSLLAGFVFSFAVVVMPGIGRLSDGAFIRAFQVIDAIIQESHPLFVLVWLGSIVGTLTTLATGMSRLNGTSLVLLVLAAVMMLAAVHVPTFLINVPLNNALQRLDVTEMDDRELARARAAFETTWNRWNTFRTVFSILATVLFLRIMLTPG